MDTKKQSMENGQLNLNNKIFSVSKSLLNRHLGISYIIYSYMSSESSLFY